MSNNEREIAIESNAPSGDGGIAVIADDFTGAAELAGIALRYGIPTTIEVNIEGGFESTLLGDGGIVVSTDSRSLNRAAALLATQKAVKALIQLNPVFIYKKTDSVLRGYVIDELKEQMQLQGLDKALLLPANPSLGRTIVDGNYYINNVLINETSFAIDPEFAVTDSSIQSMLRTNNDNEVAVLKHTDELPAKGIVVGEVSSREDIEIWLQKIDDSFLVAGAGDCFETLLVKMNHQQNTSNQLELLQPHLYVSGTSFNKSVTLIKEMEQHGCVHYLSTAIMLGQHDEEWYKQITASIQQQKKAVVAIDESIKQSINISALALRNAMAKAVKEIIETNSIHEVLIEGGSTAAAILAELNMHQFMPTHELSRGVIRMKSDGLFVTVKPGSYQLSQQIKDLYL